MSWDTPRSVRDRGSDSQVRETSGARSGTHVAEDQADRPRPRVRAPREAAGRRVAISGTSGRQRPTAKSEGHSRQKALQRPYLQPENRPMLHPCGSSRDIPGSPSQVPVGEGLRSGHGPVAEFLVGAAASSTARIHRVLSPFRALQRGRIRGGNSCDRAEASTMRTRVSHAAFAGGADASDRGSAARRSRARGGRSSADAMTR